MNIEFIPYCFFSLLFFYHYVFMTVLAVDLGDYVFVDPKNAKIKVNDLRALLDKRGVPYHEFNEKSEYINALVESGPLTVGELKLARNSTSGSISSGDIEELVTDLLAKAYEKTVLESSDIWLVRIEPNDNSMRSTLEDSMWHRLITALTAFEVEFGRFTCKAAAEYCQGKGWNSPTLLLVIPRLYNNAKNSAKAVEYTLEKSRKSNKQWVYDVDSVVKQVYSLLQGKLVRYLPSREDFDNLRTEKGNCSVHIVLLTNLRHCPFLLSALAANLNYGPWCFAFGPKTIASGAQDLPNNHVGAFYAVKSHYHYSNRWQIISQNLTTADVRDGISSAMITFKSLRGLLIKLSLREYLDFNWKFFGAVMLIFGLIAVLRIFYYRTAERQRTEELTRYILYITSKDQSDQQNLRRNVRDEEVEEEEYHDVHSFTSSSAALYSSDISNNQEISLLSIEDFFIIMTLRVTNITDWHKQVFNRYNFSHAVSEKMRRRLAHYNIRIEEIGFPPYNWILRLPTVETEDLSEDMRLSLCSICQCSIDNPADRLCCLPCNCRDIVYHYDCIAPWLIKRIYSSAHSFSSGILHTERPCPTCRYDITNWGLRQNFNYD